MPEAPHCPRCSAPMLSFASPEGLCPRCLMGIRAHFDAEGVRSFIESFQVAR